MAGGGTAGHVVPALAVAQAIREMEPQAEFLYVGTARGLEADLVPRAGLPFQPIVAAGVAGKRPDRAIAGLARVGLGLGQALRLVRRFRPAVVLVTGGYASVPAGVAAALLRVPLVIQEQNAVPGQANRLMARWAAAVVAAYPGVVRHLPAGVPVHVTGNPVLPAVLAAGREEARSALGAGARVVLLVVGGSLGARVINQAMLTAASALQADQELLALWATGKENFEEIMAGLRAAMPAASEEPVQFGRTVGIRLGNVAVAPYIYDMPTAMAAADMILCRSGGMTLAEATARGLPMILVPRREATGHHQEANAAALVAAGAAVAVDEGQLSGDVLVTLIRALVHDRSRLATMAAKSRAAGHPGAAQAVAGLCLRLARARSVS